jgi:hypothetical protein
MFNVLLTKDIKKFFRLKILLIDKKSQKIIRDICLLKLHVEVHKIGKQTVLLRIDLFCVFDT